MLSGSTPVPTGSVDAEDWCMSSREQGDKSSITIHVRRRLGVARECIAGAASSLSLGNERGCELWGLAGRAVKERPKRTMLWSANVI